MPKLPVPEPYFIHSDLEIVDANPAFCEILQANSQKQLTGTAVPELVTSNYRSRLQKRMERIENGEEPAAGLIVNLQTFSEQSQQSIIVSTLVEWDGREHVKTSVFPVSGSSSEGGRQLYNEVLDKAPIGITVSDPSLSDNTLVHVNDGFCKQTGYDRKELLGQNLQLFEGEDTHEKQTIRIREAINSGEPVATELRYYRKDGSMFWNRVILKPIRDTSGGVTNYIGYHQDITEEKQYEQDLSVFKAQAEESEKAIAITDSDGTIQYVNPTFEQVNGYTAQEAIGLNLRILKSGNQDEKFYSELWDTITAGNVWEAELVNKTKYGEFYEAKHTIIPVTDINGEEITHFVGIATDITENVLTNQTLSVLDRVMRHNLRNSLNVIDGHAELLETEELDSDTRQASISSIRDQAASMQKIAETTRRIRTIWQTDATHRMWERLDVESVVDSYQREYPGASISYSDGGVGVIQVRNAELLENALDEAVANAIKHADNYPEITIGLEQDQYNQQVRITIADNGPGIPEIEREAIDSGEETPLGHSIGIGLWTMKWTTTILGGGLAITDNEPRGSVITFQLPVNNLDGV